MCCAQSRSEILRWRPLNRRQLVATSAAVQAIGLVTVPTRILPLTPTPLPIPIITDLLPLSPLQIQKLLLRSRRNYPELGPNSLPRFFSEMMVLRHFPGNFKFRGHGHEVTDLGNLIRLYTQWHSRLLPYYSFDQFVHKVEQVAATKRVKICLRDLRERVASGVDPTKLHESQSEHPNPTLDEDHVGPREAAGLHVDGGPSTWSNDDAVQEDMLHDIFDTATQEPSQTLHNGLEKPSENNINSSSSEVVMTDEQRDRMESNRVKALEIAAVPSISNEVMITDEQRARIEANRLKALERAAARSRASQ